MVIKPNSWFYLFLLKLKVLLFYLGLLYGSFFSHGIAILFGGVLGSLDNLWLHTVLEIITYVSFLFFGIVTLINKEDTDSSTKCGILNKISNLAIGYVFIIAFSIAVGELGDKTFLASLGLGIEFPNAKIFLILGAILGMVVSDAIAILFGKFLSSKVSSNFMNVLSGIIFILFGIFGFIGFLF